MFRRSTITRGACYARNLLRAEHGINQVLPRRACRETVPLSPTTPHCPCIECVSRVVCARQIDISLPGHGVTFVVDRIRESDAFNVERNFIPLQPIGSSSRHPVRPLDDEPTCLLDPIHDCAPTSPHVE